MLGGAGNDILVVYRAYYGVLSAFPLFSHLQIWQCSVYNLYFNWTLIKNPVKNGLEGFRTYDIEVLLAVGSPSIIFVKCFFGVCF